MSWDNAKLRWTNWNFSKVLHSNILGSTKIFWEMRPFQPFSSHCVQNIWSSDWFGIKEATAQCVANWVFSSLFVLILPVAAPHLNIRSRAITLWDLFRCAHRVEEFCFLLVRNRRFLIVFRRQKRSKLYVVIVVLFVIASLFLCKKWRFFIVIFL